MNIHLAVLNREGLLNHKIIILFFWKLGIRSKDRLIRGDQSHRPLAGPHLKPEQALYGLSLPKLAPEGIEPETFGGTNSKIPSQPLGQTPNGFSSIRY